MAGILAGRHHRSGLPPAPPNNYHSRTKMKPDRPLATDDQPCEECGRFGALEIAGRRLCPECVAVAGCGCAGPGDETE